MRATGDKTGLAAGLILPSPPSPGFDIRRHLAEAWRDAAYDPPSVRAARSAEDLRGRPTPRKAIIDAAVRPFIACAVDLISAECANRGCHGKIQPGSVTPCRLYCRKDDFIIRSSVQPKGSVEVAGRHLQTSRDHPCRRDDTNPQGAPHPALVALADIGRRVRTPVQVWPQPDSKLAKKRRACGISGKLAGLTLDKP